jgi:hypothetical protein
MSPNPVRIEKKPPITLISGFLNSGGVESNHLPPGYELPFCLPHDSHPVNPILGGPVLLGCHEPGTVPFVQNRLTGTVAQEWVTAYGTLNTWAGSG